MLPKSIKIPHNSEPASPKACRPEAAKAQLHRVEGACPKPSCPEAPSPKAQIKIDLAATHAKYRSRLRRMAAGEKADRLPIMRHMKRMLAAAPELLDQTDISWYTAVLRRWQREATALQPLAAYPPAEARAIASFLLSADLPGITEATFTPLFAQTIATHAV